MITAFCLSDFYVDIRELLVLVDELVSNTSLIEIAFPRADLNEEAATAIIEKLYYNSSLQTLDLGGNNISTGLYKR